MVGGPVGAVGPGAQLAAPWVDGAGGTADAHNPLTWESHMPSRTAEGPGPDPEIDQTDVGSFPVEVEADEERTDLGLPPALPDDPEPDTGSVPSRPRPALVRSLMRRVKEQESEIRGLKIKLASLEARVARKS